MNTILTESDEVKFRSFCPKHSTRPDGGTADCAAGPGTGAAPQEEAGSGRKMKLQQLEEEFYRLVQPGDVAQHLCLPEGLVDILYHYWKLRRRANFSRPLLSPRRDEEDNLAKAEQDALLRRLKLFTHLRQDLERVRNLTYMVTRREKIKRSLCRVQEQIFQHRVRLMEEPRRSATKATSQRLEDALFLSWVSSHPGKSRKRADPSPQCPDRGGGGVQSSGRRPSGEVCELSGGRGQRRGLRCSDSQPSAERRSSLRGRLIPATGYPRAGHPEPKYNGLLRNSHAHHVSAPRPATSLLKNWGNFRIPKKSGRPGQTQAAKQTTPPCGLLERYPLSRTRSRLRAGAELGDSGVETKGKYHTPITQRYSSDIIPRSILAS